MSANCPMCGGPVHDAVPQWDFGSRMLRAGERELILSKTRARIFDALWKHRGRVIERDALVARVYGDRDDGGPVTADNSISVHMVLLRRNVTPFGIVIDGYRGTGGYRLRIAGTKALLPEVAVRDLTTVKSS